MFVYHLEYISTLQALGYYAKAITEFIIERVFIAEDVRVLDASEYSNFVETIGKLLLRKSRDSNLFHSVLAAIFLSFNAIDNWEGTFSKFGEHGVLIH